MYSNDIQISINLKQQFQQLHVAGLTRRQIDCHIEQKIIGLAHHHINHFLTQSVYEFQSIQVMILKWAHAIFVKYKKIEVIEVGKYSDASIAEVARHKYPVDTSEHVKHNIMSLIDKHCEVKLSGVNFVLFELDPKDDPETEIPIHKRIPLFQSLDKRYERQRHG